MPLRSKRDSYDLLMRGLLGNTLRFWSSFDEVRDSAYRGSVSMRYVGGSRFCAYDVPFSRISRVQKKWIAAGARKELIHFNESAPDDHLLIQGELMRGSLGLHLFYSSEKKKMREALKDGKHAKGLTAKLFLEHFLIPPSYDDMNLLLDSFPDHVVEFSTYSFCLGSMPRRNTVIWEVRAY